MKKLNLVLLLAFAIFSVGCEKSGGSNNGDTVDIAADKANSLGEKIYYEIFVRSFADSDGDGIGDLNGVTAKLDYLTTLGVEGIWLMPINPSPSYHGYDVTDYTDVHPDYGTLADFDNLVTQAKAKGIDVVLDFVLNHTSQEHPWFVNAMSSEDAEFRDYYTFVHKDDVKSMCEAGEIAMIDDNYYNSSVWRYPWGEGNTLDHRYIGQFDGSMPDLNYGRVPDMTDAYYAILDAAKFWMKRGVAGLRLDAVKHIYQNETGTENLKFLSKFYEDLAAEYPDIYMVGEVLSGAEATAPFMASLPSLFHFDAWWKLYGDLTQWGAKYYAKDMQESYNTFKVYNSEFNAAVKLSNHDEDRAMTTLGGNVELAKIAAAAIMTTPGQPYIYYGEEVGMANAKTSGDEYVREPILWGDSYTTTWRENTAPTSTVAEQLSDDSSLLCFYQMITAARKATPALQRGTFVPLPYDSLPTSMMAWYRSLGDKRVFVLMNGSTEEFTHSINYNLKDAREIVNYKGGSFVASGSTTSVTLPAYSVLIVEVDL